MKQKNPARLRRARQTRLKIREIGAVRLTVHRTNVHIYAQITSPGGDKVLASASSVEKELRASMKRGSTTKAAEVVGSALPRRRRRRHREVAFDRAGYRYHGRVKALAEAARAGGLKF